MPIEEIEKNVTPLKWGMKCLFFSLKMNVFNDRILTTGFKNSSTVYLHDIVADIRGPVQDISQNADGHYWFCFIISFLLI